MKKSKLKQIIQEKIKSLMPRIRLIVVPSHFKEAQRKLRGIGIPFKIVGDNIIIDNNIKFSDVTKIERVLDKMVGDVGPGVEFWRMDTIRENAKVKNFMYREIIREEVDRHLNEAIPGPVKGNDLRSKQIIRRMVREETGRQINEESFADLHKQLDQLESTVKHKDIKGKDLKQIKDAISQIKSVLRYR